MRAGIGPLGWTRSLFWDVFLNPWSPDDEGELEFNEVNIEDTLETTAAGADDWTALVTGSVAGAETEGTVAAVVHEDTSDAFSLSISALSLIHFCRPE
jgi:hypothetical protein